MCLFDKTRPVVQSLGWFVGVFFFVEELSSFLPNLLFAGGNRLRVEVHLVHCSVNTDDRFMGEHSNEQFFDVKIPKTILLEKLMDDRPTCVFPYRSTTITTFRC